MRFAALFTVFLGVQLLVGCAHVVPDSNSLAKRVELLLARDSFGSALDLARTLPPDHPQRKLLIEQASAQALAYERKLIAQAAERAEHGEWADARRVYQEGLRRLPHSQALRDGLAALTARQERQRARIEAELLVLQAQWVEESLARHRVLTGLAPDDGAVQRRRERLESEAADVAVRLGQSGRVAAARGDYEEAERHLELAVRLGAKGEIEAAHRQVARTRSQRDKVTRQAQEEERGRTVGKLLAEAEEALAAGRLADARERVGRLKQVDAANPEGRRLEQAVDQAVERQVRRDLEEGIAVYGQGRIEAALELWRRVQAIDPNNEQAAAHIARAERVLSKLEQLRVKRDPN